jgi:hypothetical protein
MPHRRAELEEKIRWWERSDADVRHILRAYVESNGRLHNEIGRLRAMLGEVSRVSPGPPLSSETIRKIICLLEDPHIGDNP